MKKVRYIFIIAAVILISGCVSEEKEDAVVGEEENVVIEEETGAADTLEMAENIPADEGEESSTEETENEQFRYKMNESFIVNYNEVFEKNEVFLKPYDPVYETTLEMPDCIIREEDIVGEFCEEFPEEMQQLLVYLNDSIYNPLPEESDMMWTYWAESESEITVADLPMDVDPPYNVTNYGPRSADIDSDGEEEYIQDRLFDGYLQTTVLEYDDERGLYIIGQGTVRDMGAKYWQSFVMDYEGTKYIMLQNLLVCWNETYDEEATGDSGKPWNVMAVNRETEGYTLNEIYSGEGEDIDYLAGLDLENPENNAEQYSFSEGDGAYNISPGLWDCGDWWMCWVCDWEREYNGKTYLYVVSDFSHMGSWPQDLVLTIFEEGEDCMEAVKVYYFAAHYRLSFDHVEYDTDWGYSQ